MERRVTVIERIAGMIVALVLFVVGLFFMLLGVTLLPVIGVFLGIGIIALSVRFCNLGVTAECKVITFAQADTFCPWPPISAGEEIGLIAE